MKDNLKTTPEQPAPLETTETVEEKTTQAGSVPIAEPPVAQQAEQQAATAQAQEDPVPEVSERPPIVVADSRGLNLREGPHVSYAAIAVLPAGDPVEILDLPKNVEVRGWALVETDAGIGWVNTNFLKEMDP